MVASSATSAPEPPWRIGLMGYNAELRAALACSPDSSMCSGRGSPFHGARPTSRKLVRQPFASSKPAVDFADGVTCGSQIAPSPTGLSRYS